LAIADIVTPNRFELECAAWRRVVPTGHRSGDER